MPKLKLRNRNSICKKTEKSRNSIAKTEQIQSKLQQFFNSGLDFRQSSSKNAETKQYETTSKYFTNDLASSLDKRNETEGEESFSDFQPEKAKKKIINAFDVLNQRNNKFFNQDISDRRCKSKTKVNELDDYTKQFEKACSYGGVDVNPEHLQLAVAMSLSLKDSQSDNMSQQSLSSEECMNEDDKIKKIRKTLAGYGFKVPTEVVAANTLVKRRRFKNRENYPLLTRTLEQKKQILSNLTSQIMFEDVSTNCDTVSSSSINQLRSSILGDIWCRKCSILQKASLSFEEMSEACEVFYIDNLITPTDSKPGCLLKDWSKIPGREPSPERNIENFELKIFDSYKNDFDSLLSSNCSQILNRIDSIRSKSNSSKKSVPIEEIIIESRSCSPDMFGEDDSLGDNLKEPESPRTPEKNELSILAEDSLNDSLPDVFLCKMPHNNCRLVSPLKKSLNTVEEVVCVEEFGYRTICDSSKNLTDCSIDLTQKEFELDKEPLIIVESDCENSLDSSNLLKNSSKTYNNDANGSQADKVVNNAESLLRYDLENDLMKSPITNVEKNSLSKNFINKRLASLGSIEDTIRFEEALKNYENNHLVVENSESATDSIDLTDEYGDPSDALEPSSKRLSQVYENDNGVVHYESYFEATEFTDAIDKSENVERFCKNSSISVNDGDILLVNDDVLPKKLHDSNLSENILSEKLNINNHKETNYKDENTKLEKAFSLHNISVRFVDEGDGNVSNGINNLCMGVEAYRLQYNEVSNEEPIYFCDDFDCAKNRSAYENHHGNSELISDFNDENKSIVSDDVLAKPLNVDNISNSDLSKNLHIDTNTEVKSAKFVKVMHNRSVSFIDDENEYLNNRSNDPCISSNTSKLRKDQTSESIDLTEDLECASDKVLFKNHLRNSGLEDGGDHIDLILPDSKSKELNFVDNLLSISQENVRTAANDSSDVFEISDEEFNYSINQKKSSDNFVKRCVNVMSESEEEDSLITENNKESCNQNCYEVPNDFDLYGSSIFDQIPSYCVSRISGASNRASVEMIKSSKINFSSNYVPNSNPSCSNTNEKNFEINLNLKHSPMKFEHSIDKHNMKSQIDLPIVSEGSNFKSSPVVEMTELVKNLHSLTETPPSDKFVIRVDNVTPMQDYKSMDTPQMHKELSKYGLKPLKRKRAVQILEHIYNQTHPIVNSKFKKRKVVGTLQNTSLKEDEKNISEEVDNRTKKQNCVSDNDNEENVDLCLTVNFASNKNSEENCTGDICKADRNSLDNNIYKADRSNSALNYIDNINKANKSSSDRKSTIDIYKADRSSVAIKQMDCNKEDLYFPTREKSKIIGCKVPLHIAFHNYVSMRSQLQQAILTYHPVNIDMIHKGMVADGYRYNPKDLLEFMDKKCITIKTTDKNGGSRQNKR